MRLDKFLKYSGIVKRRTLAQKLCDAGLCSLNGRVAKPAAQVHVGDIIRLQVGVQCHEYQVLELMDREVPRDQRERFRRLLSSERLDPRREL